MQPWIDMQDLRWQSDIDGEDVGRPDIAVIGIYAWRDTDVLIHVNVETMEIVNIYE